MTQVVANSIPWPKVKRSLVAILRGIRPDEAEAIVGTLIESGFELIEVPLNSPEPFVSIERLSKGFGRDCWIGAGGLGKLYEVALREAGFDVSVIDAEGASRRGLAKAAISIWGAKL